MVKVFASQGSKRMAHNLDETYQRWQARIEHYPPETGHIPTMPALRDYREAKAFQKLLEDKVQFFVAMRKGESQKSETYQHATKQIDRLRIMQASVRMQICGAKWYIGVHKFKDAIELVSLGFMQFDFDKEAMVLHVLDAEGNILMSIPNDDLIKAREQEDA